jgi:hypothetical protein
VYHAQFPSTCATLAWRVGAMQSRCGPCCLLPAVWLAVSLLFVDGCLLTAVVCSGREQGLVHCVQGLLSNPNCEYEGNFVPLRTLYVHSAARHTFP